MKSNNQDSYEYLLFLSEEKRGTSGTQLLDVLIDFSLLYWFCQSNLVIFQFICRINNSELQSID